VVLDVERREHGVAVVTLRRPERRNALSAELVARLHAAIDELTADDTVRAFVVAGEGPAFCAGADIAELAAMDGPAAFASAVHRMVAAFDALAQSPKPSVAALHAGAFGGGLELALACDLRVAEEGVRLGVPEVNLGLVPAAAGTARLPRLVAPAVARRMILTGEPLTASVALGHGLVDHVVAPGGAGAAALALASRLAALPPLALAAAKRLLDTDATFAPAVDRERAEAATLFGTDDRAEGVAAFLAKRPPVFRGR
jgi:enoyl-CoA hydratase